MRKKTIVFSIAIALMVSFGAFASRSLAEDTTTPNTPKENFLPSFLGEVKAVDGNTLTFFSRENKTYTVDATGASVVKGLLGPWGIPASVSDIGVTDTLVVVGEVNGDNIVATKMAVNKTEKAELPKVATSTEATSTLDVATTTDATSTTATSTSIIEKVTDAFSNTIQNIVNAVTQTNPSDLNGQAGGTSTSSSTSTDVTSSSTSDVASTTQTNPSDLNGQADATSTATATATSTSFVSTVINAVSSTIQNVTDALTGGTGSSTEASTTNK